MSSIDLHLHTTASDGVLSAEELVERCREGGVRLMAVTDHDSTASIATATLAARQYGITVVPGVELGTDVAGGEVHLLAYFFDIDHEEFQQTLLAMRDSRVGRAQLMVQKLGALGMPVRWARVTEIAGDASIGRPHVAQALLEAGHVSSLAEAFDKYLGRNGPAYADRYQLSPVDAVRLVRRAGGLPVVAHPFDVLNLESALEDLVPAGLAGIECYYYGYTTDQVGQLLALAKRHRLIPTGGTDFHGNGNWHEDGPGSAHVPWSVAELLFSAAGKTAPTHT